MKLLLTADLHLTDSPLEEYRWQFMEVMLPRLVKDNQIAKVWILGDLTDRKDRHSSNLVNRLVNTFKNLTTPTSILMGNHDEPISGTPYWSFLSEVEGVDYLTKPSQWINTLCLPFSSNPLEDWKDYAENFKHFGSIFMHQTLSGAKVEGNKILEHGHTLPIFPRDIPVYSGDVHRPQTIGSITYIGTPFPVRFGEDWPGRVLILDTSDFSKYQEIILPSIRRTIVELDSESINNFKSSDWKKGDQLRIRYHLSTSLLATWPEHELRIKDTIEKSGATLVSLEAILKQEKDLNDTARVKSTNLEMLNAEETLRAFGNEEKLSQELVEIGLSIINKSK